MRKGWNGIESQVCLTCIDSLRVASGPHSHIEWIALTTSNSYYLKYKIGQYWKRPWCWEGLGAGGEGDDRGWDGWMASPTWWTWVWVNSRSWWWTGRPGVLWFMGSQSRTQLSCWTEGNITPQSLGFYNSNHRGDSNLMKYLTFSNTDNINNVQVSWAEVLSVLKVNPSGLLLSKHNKGAMKQKWLKFCQYKQNAASLWIY